MSVGSVVGDSGGASVAALQPPAATDMSVGSITPGQQPGVGMDPSQNQNMPGLSNMQESGGCNMSTKGFLQLREMGGASETGPGAGMAQEMMMQQMLKQMMQLILVMSIMGALQQGGQ